ncbi:bifunctional alpha,alpha-trehalose-phosphate synthase (UDP-forming)/trehalose-phosphatase [Bdellovibrio sp. HCB274]|uniref:bifunctional alpha,alpha-trehalose-phosphate synthase (UDP-forming)/trehalose-phosphatase n=1 Tax=Bdellovibrio sp. HCB274 TaxID=3394361 RepID=UPI0039B4D2CD
MISKSKRIFVSNRLPFNMNSKGELKRGSGGLVSALMGVCQNEPFAWFGFETDASHAAKIPEEARKILPHLDCYPVVLSKDKYDKYYNGFANDIIWPLFHYESHLANFNRKNWEQYKDANKLMAQEIAKVATPGVTVWIHDFHFMTLPEYLRELVPDIKIGFFLHIPFPSAELFRQLPVREEILRGLLSCDLVGFHEHSYLRQFVVSLKACLGVDSSFFRAEYNGRTTHFGVYPISIEGEEIKEKSRSEAVLQKVENYKSSGNAPFMILGIDRLDYTKGLELKLKGLQAALRKYPDLVGQVSLMQIAIPTREKVPAYMKIKKEVDQLVGNINGEFGSPSYTPVHYVFNSVSETELLALYRHASSVLVTSKRDGMNLVAMEYVMAQDLQDPGVLILSEFAGAASLLSDALIVNPWDVDAIADAIHQAYCMDMEERNSRMEHLQEILSRYSSSKWARGFLKELESVHQVMRFSPKVLKPSRSTWSDEFNKQLSQGRLKILIDYDGTIVPIAKRPEQVVLMEETRDLLTRLSQQADVYVISGRTREFLDAQLKGMNLGLIAEHGAFYREPNGDWVSRISTDVQSWYPHVERIMNDYSERVPLSFVEKKKACLVWHFRLSPTDFASFQSKKLDDELQVGMANEPVTISMGNKIVEAKAVECNKGNFVRWLMKEKGPNSTIVCLGDDRTDEDMFVALGKSGISIKVGDGATAARNRLKQQTDVVPFLKELIQFVNENAENDLDV